jgi:hypothetical protein
MIIIWVFLKMKTMGYFQITKNVSKFLINTVPIEIGQATAFIITILMIICMGTLIIITNLTLLIILKSTDI